MSLQVPPEPPLPPVPEDASPALPEPFSHTRVRTLVWVMLAWFVVLIVFTAMDVPIVLTVNTIYFVLLLWVVRQCARSRVEIRQFLRWPAASDVRKIWLVLPTLLVSLAFIGLLIAVVHLSPSVMRDPEMEQAIRRNPLSAQGLLTAFSMVVAAPFAEELVFRGIILHTWARRWGLRRAALASSACFAMLHLDPPGAFLFALVMVHLYTRSGTLLVPMAAHAFNNALVVAVILGGRNAGQDNARAANLSQAVPGMIIVGFVGLSILLLYFRRQPRMSQWRLPLLLPSATPAR